MNHRLPVRVTGLLLAAALAWAGQSWAHNDHRRSGQIRAITQNLYVGANLFRILSVTAPEQVPVVVAEIFDIIHQTDFQSRADAIADTIRDKRPDVIGLQEVSLIRIQTPSDYFIGNPNGAETVVYDYLRMLLVALQRRGLHYRVAARVTNADIELPSFAGVDEAGVPRFNDVRLTDRDVILVRKGVKTRNAVGANFQVNLQIPLAGQVIPFTRGYTMVDARVRGKRYRIVNTHLEVRGEGPAVAVQALQAQELIGILATESKPTIVLGDLNSSPTDKIDLATGAIPPYAQFAYSGYQDSWLKSANTGLPGYTCCQAELLLNPLPALSERIDYVLFRNRTWRKTRVSSDVVGDETGNKTAAGLWPSDHAGVFARIRFPVKRRW